MVSLIMIFVSFSRSACVKRFAAVRRVFLCRVAADIHHAASEMLIMHDGAIFRNSPTGNILNVS